MITPIRGTLFTAPSLSGGRPYVIDIAEYRGNGSCSCPDFLTRCKPVWDESKVVVEFAEKDPARTRCKHINAVILHLGNTLAQRISATR
jgi:hypothetical protein